MSIRTTASPTNDFNTSTVLQDVGSTVIPGIKGAFSYAADGIGSFVENNPNTAKWAAFGLALLAAPTLISSILHPVEASKNAGSFALNAGKWLVGAAVGLTLASAVSNWASNHDAEFSLDAAKNAMSETVGDIGNLFGANGPG